MKIFPYAIVLALCAAQFSTLPVFAHPAIEPVPRTDQRWKDRQELLNKRAADAGEKAQVVFIGDSITQGWEGNGKEVWAQYYAHRNAVNLGIGGDRTQHVLWRLDNGNLDGLKPKAAVLMIGTNNSNGEDNSAEEIADGVTAIVKKLREKLPNTKVLLVAMFPRGEKPNPQRGKILQVNQILQKLADEKNIFWIDFGYTFITSQGTIPRELMPDFLHLTKRGYEIWAESIEDRLSSVLGDKRTQPAAARATSNLTGEWVSAVRNQEGQTFESTLVLKSDGDKVTGKFSRGEDRWLEIQNGQVKGDEVSWLVKRDRSDGTILTYRMSGRIDGDQLAGKAKATLDGNEVTFDWSAKRK